MHKHIHLYIAGVITIAAVSVTAYFILAILGFESAKAESLLHTVQPTRPQQCVHLLRDPNPDTWDATTDLYPSNEAWATCMGVRAK